MEKKRQKNNVSNGYSYDVIKEETKNNVSNGYSYDVIYYNLTVNQHENP